MCDTDDDGDGILDVNEGYSFYVEDFERVPFYTGIRSGTTSITDLVESRKPTGRLMRIPWLKILSHTL